MKKINSILKLFLFISLIIMLGVFTLFNILSKQIFYNLHYNIVYISLCVFINLALLIYSFKELKNDANKTNIIMIIIFFIIMFLAPIYESMTAYAPTGPGSELMGLAVRQEHRNIYGILIKNN